MALHQSVELASSPEVAGLLIAPSHAGGFAHIGGDRPRHDEHQLVRLVRNRKAAELLDLLAGVCRAERLHPFALEDEAPATFPGHHIASALPSRLAEMLRSLKAFAEHQPKAETLEVER